MNKTAHDVAHGAEIIRIAAHKDCTLNILSWQFANRWRMFLKSVPPFALRNTLVRNGLYGLLEIGAPFLLMLLATPFLLHKMGTEQYGLWNVALAFFGLMGVFDLGAGTATTKFIAEYSEKKDRVGVSTTATISIILMAVIAAVTTVALYVVAPHLVGLFSSSAVSAEQLQGVFRLCALGLFPALLQNVGLAVPKGFQDYRTPTLILLFENALTLILACLIVLAGGNVVQVVIGTIAVQWVFATASLFAASMLLTSFGAGFVFSLQGAPKILKFMLFMGLTGIGIKIFTFSDRILVAQVLGLTTAAYYVIATGIANKFSALGSAITQSLMPAFSSWAISKTEHDITRRLIQATIVIGFVVLVPGVAFLLTSKAIMILWLGRQTGEAVLPAVQILVFVYVVRTVSTPAFQATNGLGFPAVTAFTAITSGVGTLLLIALLGPRFGLVGAAWANAASWITFYVFVHLFLVLRRPLVSKATTYELG